MRKLLGVVVAILAVVGVFAIALALSVVRGGFSARTTASRLEVAFVETVRDLAVPRSARAEKNPVPSTPDALERGRRNFAKECALCHGNDGRGQTELALGMFPPPPDLRTVADLTDGEIHHVIENGIRFSGMAAFGRPGDAEMSREHWEIVVFIRHLPHQTAAEVAEMKRYNPRLPAEAEEHPHH
jgi:mono/diheme cytochrome c family protein